MSKMDVYKEIDRVLTEHIDKYGDKLNYVSFPYVDGQFLKRLHVLTPTGIETLQQFLEIKRMTEKGISP